MPGSSIAINGWNIISGRAVALNLCSGLSTDRSTNLHAVLAARGLILHFTRTGRWKLPRWS